MTVVIADDDGNGGSRAASGKPVTPTDDEAGVVTECSAREIILTAAARNRSSELGHGGRTTKSIEPAEHPDSKKQPGVGQSLRDIARSVDNAGSDCVSDGRRHPKPHAQGFQQPTAAVGLSGRRQRAGRQFSPPKIAICWNNKAAIITFSTEIASSTEGRLIQATSGGEWLAFFREVKTPAERDMM